MYTLFLQDPLKILLHIIGPLLGLKHLKPPGGDKIWLCFTYYLQNWVSARASGPVLDYWLQVPFSAFAYYSQQNEQLGPGHAIGLFVPVLELRRQLIFLLHALLCL